MRVGPRPVRTAPASAAVQADARAAIDGLARRHPRHAAAIRAAVAPDALWPARFSVADSRHVLAAAIDAVPLAEVAARRPASVAVVNADSDGASAVPRALELLTAAYASGSDVTVGPEWLFAPADLAHSVASRDALLDELRALTRGSGRLLVPGTIPWRDAGGGYHNTAYALADGEVLKEIDKRGDGDDAELAARAGLGFVSRPCADSTFRWRDLTVGLEICRDHGDARLRWEREGQVRPVVDVQIVPSSGVWLKHAAVGNGGLVVVAQGDASLPTEVFTRDDGLLSERAGRTVGDLRLPGGPFGKTRTYDTR